MSLRTDKKLLLKRMQNCVRVLVAKVWLSMVSTSWGEETGSGEPDTDTHTGIMLYIHGAVICLKFKELQEARKTWK